MIDHTGVTVNVASFGEPLKPDFWLAEGTLLKYYEAFILDFDRHHIKVICHE